MEQNPQIPRHPIVARRLLNHAPLLLFPPRYNLDKPPPILRLLIQTLQSVLPERAGPAADAVENVVFIELEARSITGGAAGVASPADFGHEMRFLQPLSGAPWMFCSV